MGIKGYLRTVVHDHPRQWLKCLPWMELWHNSTYQFGMKMTPFMALYGIEALAIPRYVEGTSKVVAAAYHDLEGQQVLVRLPPY